MARFFTRKEEKAMGRRGNREVVRVRYLQGDWIVRQEPHAR
jgi:hypothetical protein